MACRAQKACCAFGAALHRMVCPIRMACQNYAAFPARTTNPDRLTGPDRTIFATNPL